MFVLERVDTMNDEVANRLLKTLEEPAHFVHLILLTDALGRVLETVVSRCQLVRFDPLPAARIAAALEAEGVDAERAPACARLALGNATRARLLASPEGEELRGEVEALRRAPRSTGEPGESRGGRCSSAPSAAAPRPRRRSRPQAGERLELEPKGRERRAIERELEEAAKRDGRRARTEVLDLALTLTGLAFRDLVCLAEDAPEAVLGARPRRRRWPSAPAARDPRRLREAAERCEDVRQALELNVSEDLALSALGLRLAALAGSPG